MRFLISTRFILKKERKKEKKKEINIYNIYNYRSAFFVSYFRFFFVFVFFFMTFPSRSNEMANTAAVCSAGGRVRSVPSLLFSIILLTVFAGLRVSSADVHAVTGHVRHKRTVSDLFEGLMNAMYFHMDPVPVSSTVIAHITKMPPATRVYK